MKRYLIFIVLITIVGMLSTCSINIAGGATSETTNGMVSATIVHEDGTPASHTPVFLIPLSYDPARGNSLPDNLHDTTDENGNCNIIVERKLKIDIEVDGGIAPGTACLAKKAGANVFVAGGAIYKAKSIKSAVQQLKNDVKCMT